MASVTIRRLSEQTKQSLVRQALRQAQTLEAYLRDVLDCAASRALSTPDAVLPLGQFLLQLGGSGQGVQNDRADTQQSLSGDLAACTVPQRGNAVHYLLDTMVVLETLGPAPDHAVVAWLDAHSTRAHLSTPVVFKLRQAVAVMTDTVERRRHRISVDRIVQRLAQQMYVFDVISAQSAAGVAALWSASGQTRDPSDAMLAGTALAYNLSLCTRNTDGFGNLDVMCVNPWAGKAL